MDRIVLGSGILFLTIFTGTIPADTEIEKDDNKLGDIKGGATMEYTATWYDAIDDSGRRSKRIITEEKALLKSGIMTWNGLTLRKLVATARVTESGGRRTVRIGGTNNQNGEKYLLRFLHKDEVDGDCRLTIIGTNQAGLALAFAKTAETVINAEFNAFPHPDGTLIIYDEEIIPEQSLTLTSVEGEETGTTEITVTPAKAVSNTYKSKVGQFLNTPSAGDTLDGYANWDGVTPITAPNGYTVVIAEVDGSGTCVKYGSTTAVSKI